MWNAFKSLVAVRHVCAAVSPLANRNKDICLLHWVPWCRLLKSDIKGCIAHLYRDNIYHSREITMAWILLQDKEGVFLSVAVIEKFPVWGTYSRRDTNCTVRIWTFLVCHMLGLGPRAAKTSLVFHIPHALWSWEAASLVQSGLSIQPRLKNKQIPEEHKERTHWKGLCFLWWKCSFLSILIWFSCKLSSWKPACNAHFMVV